MMIWNIVLTALVAMMGFFLKDKFAELGRLGVLLNKTREEIARDHITRAEVRADMEKLVEHVDNRFNRIEVKLDVLAKGT
jgi:hypothetical protein